MEFSLEVRKVEGIAVLDLQGRLCLGNALLTLRDAVKQTLNDGTNKLAINLNGLTFIDSSGLGELITTHTYSERAWRDESAEPRKENQGPSSDDASPECLSMLR